jgi:DNA transformation protein
MSTPGYVDYILDVLSSLGNIKARKMFGGYGIYKNATFFALIIDDVLYFKVGDANLPAYKAKKSKPFSYTSKNGKSVAMSYWELPSDILEDHQELARWVEKSVAVAQAAKNETARKKALGKNRKKTS